MQAATELDRVKALLTMVTGFVVLYFIFDQEWLLYLAGGVGVLSLMIPAAGKGIVWLWFKIALVLGWINSRILLSIVFYVFLFPIALLFKLSSKNPLQLKKDAETSLWHERRHTYEAKDLDNIW